MYSLQKGKLDFGLFYEVAVFFNVLIYCSLRSKLHLVDLAGSEQARRSGKQLDDEHFFNLSLYHLESVVIALKKFRSMSGRNKGRRTSKSLDHSSSTLEINERPSSVVNDSELNRTLYRNSILTMVLQESLGKCKYLSRPVRLIVLLGSLKNYDSCCNKNGPLT